MSKTDEESVREEPKDEQTAKFLHKLSENGKECGLPASLVAHYAKKAWDATKSDEKYFSCGKCGMPPPPQIELIMKQEASPECKNCGTMNEKPIGVQSEVEEKERKEENIKKQEERKSLKRPSGASDKEHQPAHPRIIMAQPPALRMARRVAPQLRHLQNKPKPLPTPPTLPQMPTLLNPKPSKKAKKPKIVQEKEPEFLQKLFGIGAKPV